MGSDWWEILRQTESWAKPSEHRLLGVTATGDVIMWHKLAMEWMGVCQCVCPAHPQYINPPTSSHCVWACFIVNIDNKQVCHKMLQESGQVGRASGPPTSIHSCISLSIAPSIMLLDQNIIPCQHIDLLIFIILYSTQPTLALQSRHSNKLNEMWVDGQMKTTECFL